MDLPPISISVCGFSVVLVVLLKADEGVGGGVDISGTNVEKGTSVKSGFELGAAVNNKTTKKSCCEMIHITL